jgi:uncharacterized protein (UPF0305 family)
MKDLEKDNNIRQKIKILIKRIADIRKRQINLLKEIDDITSEEKRKEILEKLNK